jgi:hypothetical protein
MNNNFILIIGNPIDGFHHYGPFETHEDALEAAESNEYGHEWWIAPLKTP